VSSRPILQPSAKHPIVIKTISGRVTVRFDGQVVAQSDRALELLEAKYPPAIYVPRQDVKMDALARSEHSTYCPFKGDASYYSVADGGERGQNSIWSYETPYGAVASIKDHLAFYGDRFEITTRLLIS
jgi:uncharacterized protein (DUF427 family)